MNNEHIALITKYLFVDVKMINKTYELIEYKDIFDNSHVYIQNRWNKTQTCSKLGKTIKKHYYFNDILFSKNITAGNIVYIDMRSFIYYTSCKIGNDIDMIYEIYNYNSKEIAILLGKQKIIFDKEAMKIINIIPATYEFHQKIETNMKRKLYSEINKDVQFCYN